MDDPMARALPEGWVDAATGEPALWRSRPDDFYWFEHLPEHNLVYFQYNQVRDQGEATLAEFVTELLAFIDDKQIQTLVIDIRQNNGGNSYLNPGLMIPLAAHPIAREEGRLFVIAGRRTFSAAQNLANDLDRETKAIFVGEPTGSRPNFYGEDHVFRLAYSGLTGSISTRYWQGGATSDDDRIWIAPRIAAEPDFADYRDSRDPALTAILEHAQTAP
jgi:hypothetical protein